MRVSRRQFFSARHTTRQPLSDEAHWIHIQKPAMACRFEITLPPEATHAISAAHEALSLLEPLEAQLSVFRDHSEISALNASASRTPSTVETRLFDLLAFCRSLHAETG